MSAVEEFIQTSKNIRNGFPDNWLEDLNTIWRWKDKTDAAKDEMIRVLIEAVKKVVTEGMYHPDYEDVLNKATARVEELAKEVLNK